MVRNKYYIGSDCKRCDNEGLVSACCGTEIKFLSNGATKCVKCKKICKLDYCTNCKEDETYKIITDNNDQEHTPQQETKQKSQTLYYIILIVFTLINTIIYVASRIK